MTATRLAAAERHESGRFVWDFRWLGERLPLDGYLTGSGYRSRDPGQMTSGHRQLMTSDNPQAPPADLGFVRRHDCVDEGKWPTTIPKALDAMARLYATLAPRLRSDL